MFDYKKHSRNIILGFIFSTIIIFGIYLALIYLYRPLYIPAEYGVQSTVDIKLDLYGQRDKSKNTIFITAGSNGIYGINTPVINEAINYEYNVLNFAIHAGMPIQFYYNLVGEIAQKGDVILLPIEHHYIMHSNELTDWHYKQFSTWARDRRYILPSNMRYDLLIKNITSYWTRFKNINKQLPLLDKVELYSHIGDDVLSTLTYGPFGYDLLSSGDYLIDLPNNKQKDGSYLNVDAVSEDFITDFKAFKSEMDSKGVQVYIAYAVSQRHDKFDYANRDVEEQFIKFKELFANMGVDVIGNPEFYNMDVKYFFDTEYHLNATGSILRSLILADEINTFVLNNPPAYKQGEEAEYFKNKEVEAEQYVQMLREKQALVDAGRREKERSIKIDKLIIMSVNNKLFVGELVDNYALFESGWSGQEDWGRWTDGTNAELTIKVTSDVKGVKLRSNMFMPGDSTFDLNILVNGTQVLSESYTQPVSEINIPLPQEVINNLANNNIINIELQMPNVASPKELGLSEDSRKLGIGLKEFEIY